MSANLGIIMKTREEIVGNWLVRYTHRPLEDFTPYVLLTNFNNYVDLFCEQCGVEAVGYGANMRTAVADGITIVNFGMGSPTAALGRDLLRAVQPAAGVVVIWRLPRFSVADSITIFPQGLCCS